MVPLLAWPAALLIGISLGMLGAGGSILTVPLLHGAAGLSVPDATVTSLPVVGLVALAGLWLHRREGTVRLAEALPFAVVSFAAAFASRSWLAPHLPTDVQVVAFATLMLVAGWRMAIARPPEETLPRRRSRGAVLGVAASIGVVTGLLGIGGGFLIVPALVLFLAFDVRAAVGTSLAVIACNCAGGLAGHVAGVASGETAAALSWPVALVFSAAGVAGAFAGARLAHRLPVLTLRRCFSVLVFAMAAWLLWAHFASA
jgi:uncharacterized membrane protein YfcA